MFSLILNYFQFTFFGELPTITGHRVIQVYSRQIPFKVGDYSWLINRLDYCRNIMKV